MNLATDLTWHRSLLAGLAWRMRPKCYIELGLPHTPTIYDVARWCGMAYGVDCGNNQPPDEPNVRLFTMTTDLFFSDIAYALEPPELVFIDACHEKGQVVKDLDAVARICADNCMVLIHDTFPEATAYLAPEYCSDSWEVPGLLAWEHVTLPTPPGLTICRLKPQSLV